MRRTSGAREGRARSRARRSALRAAAAALAIAAMAGGAGVASAQPKLAGATHSTRLAAAPTEVQGTVIELDKDGLVLDLGTAAGATSGVVLDLWRPFRIKHPVSGKLITDRFKIGQIQIEQVRPSMSLSKPVGSLSRPAEAGDLVFLTPPEPPPAPTPAVARVPPVAPAPAPAASDPYEPCEAEPAEAADPDAKNVTDMFDYLKNTNIPVRIAKYEEFLRAHPGSRFFTVIFEENIALKRLLAPQPTASAPGAQNVRPQPALLSGPGRMDAVPGQPIRVAVELTEGADGAVLQVRKKGESLYVPIPMARVGKGYFAATIPGERIDEKDIEYFIEAVGSGGYATPMLGTSREP